MLKRRLGYYILGVISGILVLMIFQTLRKHYKTSHKRTLESAYLLTTRPTAHNAIPREGAYSGYNVLPNRPVLKVKFINSALRTVQPEDARLPMIHDILAEKYNLQYSNDNYDILMLSFDKYDPIPPKQHNVVSIYHTIESYVGNPKPYLDNIDLVMGFDFIEKDNYIRRPYAYAFIPDAANKMRHDYKRPGRCKPSQHPYFACFLVSNHGDWFPEISDGVAARDRIFHKLSLYKKVMSGGKHLNNIGEAVKYEDTEQWLSQCKFIIAYENTLNYPGYITEKPYQAWFAGGVPIYNAHASVLSDINPKAMLFAGDFKSEDEFVEYIKKVDNDDDLYCKIWNEQIITDPSKDYNVLEDKIRKKLFELVEQKVKK